MARSSVFSDSVATATINSIVEDINRSSVLASSFLGGSATWSGGSLAYDDTQLRSESPGEERARYIAEISTAIGGRSERAVDEKKSSGKKSQAVTPNESYNKWAVQRSGAPVGLYQQLAAQGLGNGRSTFNSFKGNITSTF